MNKVCLLFSPVDDLSFSSALRSPVPLTRVQKLTSGLVSKTERSLAQKAGHLEILAGGKKDKNGQKK